MWFLFYSRKPRSQYICILISMYMYVSTNFNISKSVYSYTTPVSRLSRTLFHFPKQLRANARNVKNGGENLSTWLFSSVGVCRKRGAKFLYCLLAFFNRSLLRDFPESFSVDFSTRIVSFIFLSSMVWCCWNVLSLFSTGFYKTKW